MIGSIYSTFSFAQEFSGQYTAEWQWDMNKNTNWANLLRLDMNIPIGKGNDAFEAATIHVSKTNGSSDISSDKVSIKGPLEKVCGYRSTIKILFCPFIKLNNG